MAENKYPTSPDDYLSACKNAAKELGIDWQILDTVISFETAGTRSLTKKNPQPGQSARGLIQFINKTAIGLGYKSSLDLVQRENTYAKQFKIVVRYLKEQAKWALSNGLPTDKIGQLVTVYLLIFYPAYAKYARSKSQIVAKSGSAVYAKNKGFDLNKDGNLTTEEIGVRIIAQMKIQHPEYYNQATSGAIASKGEDSDTTEKKD